MIASFRAEWLKVSKRRAFRVVAILWTLLILATYFVTYVGANSQIANRSDLQSALATFLPPNALLFTFQFYNGLGAAVMGLLTIMIVGSEFGWGTLKTILTQRPGRMTVLGGKFLLLLFVLVLFTADTFIMTAIASSLVGAMSGFGGAFPAIGDIAKILGAFLLVTTAWMTVAATLAMLLRGTGFAIGLYLIYFFVIQNFINLIAQISLTTTNPILGFIATVNKVLIGASSGSLSNALTCAAPATNILRGTTPCGTPGATFVTTDHAILILFAYIIVCTAISLILIRQREVAS